MHVQYTQTVAIRLRSLIVDELSHRKSNRALTYRKSRGVSNMWSYHGMPEVESCVNIPEVEGRAREQWVKMSGMVRLVISYDESFDSSRIVSIRQHLQLPFTDTCVIFFKCLANRHPVWRVVICCDESFDLSRFDNIFNPLSQTLAEYFLSLLQTNFRYAFPCHKNVVPRSTGNTNGETEN